jgi:hypothetical protein
MRVTLNDGRSMTGQMLAFDKVRHFVGVDDARANASNST